MSRRSRLLTPLAVMVLLLALTPAASAGHRDDPHTRNLHPLGHTDDNRPVASFEDPFFTDIAFWDGRAYQGTWSGGFRIIDIRSPLRTRVLSEVSCGEFQGDIGVWDDLVFRSIDFPVAATTPQETCTAPLAPEGGFEGIQIFQVGDPRSASAEDIVAAVGTDCGSHTHTVVPDPANNRVLIYVSSSATAPEYAETVFGNQCTAEHGKFVIVEVPLDAPETAAVIGEAKLGPEDGPALSHDCHDIGVLSNGDQQLAVCAGTPVATVHDITDPANPVFLTSFTTEGVSGWHSAALSWDGSVTVMGWEPGGGVAPECEATDPEINKSLFFFDTYTGELLGTWVLPQPQSALENCTLHNYNVVPSTRRDVVVMGNYQAGTWVVDFTDPTNARTVAWSDPPPADPANLTLAGAWGSYWYNGLIYETNITEGVNVFGLISPLALSAQRLPYLNPQSQIGPLH